MSKNLDQDIISDGNLVITRIKAQGGYVVNSYDKSHNILGSCFVPDLRTQIATEALQGILSNASGIAEPEHWAKFAVKYADALITELNKGKDNE